MTHTPQSIRQALIDIAYPIANEYDEKLNLLEPSAKTEKKALSIQREIAKLCNHAAGLNSFGESTFEQHTAVIERRFRNITAHYRCSAVIAYYDALPTSDRPLVLFYLQSLYFMTTNFLNPWKAELTRAEEAGDAAAAFELKLKIHTVRRVLDARNAWWQEHANELPAMPKDVRNGKEMGYE